MNPTASNGAAGPFVKWAGGKARLLSEIRASYPAELGGRVCRYAEPFVGGGAVLFDILNRYRLREVYISDVNRELIHTYLCVRDRADECVRLLSAVTGAYLAAGAAEQKQMYYARRTQYNQMRAAGSFDTELAALFIFLNHTCYNGLYRVNDSGGFNVPQGRYKNPFIFGEANIRAASKRLSGVRIEAADYKQSAEFIDERTFVYFDPPYRPLSPTSRFTAYAHGGFDDAAQTELARFVDDMHDRGAHVLISNSDPRNTDENDDFFDRLYARYDIRRIHAPRRINANTAGRGQMSELLIYG